MQPDLQSTEPDRWTESSLRLPLLVAPLVSGAVVLVMVVLAPLVWPQPTSHAPAGVPRQPASSTPR